MTITKEQLIENVFKKYEDPELNIDVWTLGLIYEVKIDGNKVKVDVVMRGREQAHAELAFDLIKKFDQAVAIPHLKESGPTKIGNTVSIIISPQSKP